MNSRAFFAIFALAGVAACAASEPEGAPTAGANLVGGTVLKDGDLPSSLFVSVGCTGTKVGPRHILLAAHCVYDAYDAESSSLYPDGAEIEVSAAVSQTNDTPRQTLTVKHVHIAPEWINTCHDNEDDCVQAGTDGDAHRASDVALIETVEEIAQVPIAAIDTEPLVPGEAVIVTGFGCESSVGGFWSYDTSRLKAGVVRLLPSSALLHSGSYVTAATAPVIAAHELITPGPAWATPGPGLCPGDSGGAVYRAKGGGGTVVGVNTRFTFSGPITRGNLPVTNAHARLDTATPGNIGGWLASLGAMTCSGATCPTRTPPAALSTVPPMPAPDANLASHGRDLQCQQAVTDVSAIEAELDRALGQSTLCTSVDGHRVPAANDTYTYAALVSCSATLTAADEARLPAGFTYRDGVITRALESPPCDSFPIGDAGCRATLMSSEALVVDVKRATGQTSTCSLETPQLEDGVYTARFSCPLEQGFASEVLAARSVIAMYRLGYSQYADVEYDAGHRALHGVVQSITCATFR